MLKTQGYDEAPSGFQQKESINVGGHHMIIKQVAETMSKGDPEKKKEPKPMVVILFDFAENDAQKGMFMAEFKADDRNDKKWPNRATSYIMTQDWQDPSKTNRNFKSFCTCFEKSNGVAIKWVEDPVAWAAQFKNKKIGGVFGKTHSVYNGREIVKEELRWFCDDAKAEGQQVPNEKMLTDAQKAQLNPAGSTQTSQEPWQMPQPTGDSGFLDVPEGIDDELPFA